MFKYGNIFFKAVEEIDLQTLCNMRYDEEINEQLFNVWPITMFSQKDWLKTMLSNSKYKVFMVKNEDDVAIGCVRLQDIDFLNRKIEVGVDVLEHYRNKSFGFKIYEALIKYCFNYLNMRKIYLYVFEDNRAVKLYEKIGFITGGVLKEHVFKNGWKNVLIMSIIKN